MCIYNTFVLSPSESKMKSRNSLNKQPAISDEHIYHIINLHHQQRNLALEASVASPVP